MKKNHLRRESMLTSSLGGGLLDEEGKSHSMRKTRETFLQKWKWCVSDLDTSSVRVRMGRNSPSGTLSIRHLLHASNS